MLEADEYPIQSELRNDILHLIQNSINILEYEEDAAMYDRVIKQTEDQMEVSYHRARFELERAMDKGLVSRDRNIAELAD